jgi:hypothetical protein
VTLSPDTVALLNRAGLALGFVSFWFAAPEFIGEDRLRSWEQALASGFKAAWIALTVVLLVLPLTLFGAWVRMAIKAHRLVEVPVSFIVVYLVLIFWGPLDRRVQNLLQKLADNSRLRQNAFVIGAVLFTVSFVLQLAATF